MSPRHTDGPALSVQLIAPDLRSMGGYEAQLASLSAGLRQAGHDVSVFFREPISPDHPYLKRMLEAGVAVDAPDRWTGRLLSPRHAAAERVRRVLIVASYPVVALLALADSLWRRRPLARAWQGARGRWHELVSQVLFANRLDERLGRTLDRSHRPDLIDVQHSMIPFGIRYAKERQIPVIYTEYGAPAAELESVWAGLRGVIGQADHVIGRAQASITGLRAVCGMSLDQPLTIVPNAVIAGPPDGDEGALRQPSSIDGVVITAIGRLSPEKGTPDLLAAFRQLADEGFAARLVLAGDGPLRAKLEQRARDWGIADRVTFTGVFADLVPIMRTTHIVAHPTLNDGRSVSVLEAMAWGRPVVATAVGGVAELVRDGETGLLVAPADPDAMAASLRRLANDADLRQRMGTAARASFVAGGYSAECMIAQTLAVYRQVIRGSTAPESDGTRHA